MNDMSTKVGDRIILNRLSFLSDQLPRVGMISINDAPASASVANPISLSSLDWLAVLSVVSAREFLCVSDVDEDDTTKSVNDAPASASARVATSSESFAGKIAGADGSSSVLECVAGIGFDVGLILDILLPVLRFYGKFLKLQQDRIKNRSRIYEFASCSITLDSQNHSLSHRHALWCNCEGLPPSTMSSSV